MCIFVLLITIKIGIMRDSRFNVIRTTETTVPAKQSKNGSWYADVSKIEKPNTNFYKSGKVTKTKRQAEGKEFESVTLICTWTDKPKDWNSVQPIWNEKK